MTGVGDITMAKECNPLVPVICRLTMITRETPDTKTFRIQTMEGGKPFDLAPGQLVMLSVIGVGEGMFSITAQGGDWIETSIKKTGMMTDALHEMAEGDTIGLRGPYGNYFSVEAAKGKDILFIGGGNGKREVKEQIHAQAQFLCPEIRHGTVRWLRTLCGEVSRWP